MYWSRLECCKKYEEDSKDRKSTRLNSSHLGISYAVFCLKKKKSRVKRAQNLHIDELLNRSVLRSYYQKTWNSKSTVDRPMRRNIGLTREQSTYSTLVKYY